MKFLENDTLILRAVEPSDSDFLFEIENDSSQWRDNGMMAPYSMRNVKEYAENYDADPIRSGQLRMVAQLKDSKEMVGIADLYEINALGRTAFTGIYILNKFRNRGHAEQILRLLESYASQLLNLRVIGAKISERNSTSIGLFERSGYQRVGLMTDWLLSGKETSGLAIYIKPL